MTDLVDKVNNIYVREISDLRNQIESRDPEREQLKEVIGELQSEEWFAALPPKLQLSAAKKHAQLKQGATRGTKPTTITRSPGGSGRRVVAPKPTGEGYSDEEKAYLASVGLLGKQESNDQSML